MHARSSIWLPLVLVPIFGWAKPPSREETDRRQDAIKELKESVAVETTDSAKFGLLERAWTAESSIDMRRRIIELAAGSPGPLLDAFLSDVVSRQDDAGLRSQAATSLGRLGSEKCLPLLLKVAASDRTSEIAIGDIRGSSSARRSATFAVAELAARFPKLMSQATAGLNALPGADDPKDPESLADARRQALFQVSRDEKLLAPFFERLKSNNASERERGVIAFRFLKLHNAPPEIEKSLEDFNPGVQSWAALVLGEIGDAQSAKPLMAVAADAKRDRSIRVNAITALGQMRAMPAGELMEKLLADPEVSVNAAIALYRITGVKVKQFPEGYNAD